MKNNANTKSRIVSAAWKLFYEQGYDDTTIEDIVLQSQTSKGSFYHYFESKDALLGSLSVLFDEKYEQLIPTLDTLADDFSRLMYLNHQLFRMIENSVSLDLLARMYSSQIITKGDKHLLDRNRIYYKILRKIFMDGQASGEFVLDVSVNDMVKTYALCERALLYDYCMCNGEYSLTDYSDKMMPMFLGGYRTAQAKK